MCVKCTHPLFMKPNAAPPEISEKAAADIVDAARKAYGNDNADNSMDRVLAHARDFQERKRQRGEKVVTE